MISASIIVSISILAIVNFRGSTQKSTLDNEAERLSSIIRQANINTLTGLTVGGSRPIGGFGVRITQCSANCSYILFADDGNHQYDNGEEVQRPGMLDDNVFVSSTFPANPLDIVFVPPRGDIYINGVQTSDASATLAFGNTDYSKQIIIYQETGRINIQ